MFDEEKVQNLRTRVRNLTHSTPFSSFKAVFESFIDLLKQESLETGAAETQEQRDARRVAINNAKQELLDLMSDPEALYAQYLEARRANENQN